MRLELSSFVETDLEEIADLIAAGNPRRALTFIQEIRHEFVRVSENPFLYQLCPEIGEDARMAVVGRYAILFRTLGDTVRVERVVFGGRNLPALLQP